MPSDAPGTSLDDAMNAGDKAYRQGQFVDAARHFARVVADDGSQALGWRRLGDARWRRGDRDGAIEAYRRAAEEEPTRARSWHNLSTALLAADRFPEAASAATHAVTLEPKRGKAWNNLAVARNAIGDRVGAETALRRALEAEPDLAVARANLGGLLLAAGRTEEALEPLARAFVEGQTDPETRRALARARRTRGDVAAAEALLVEGVQATPQCTDLWVDLGDMRRDRGDPSGALDAYEAAASAAADMEPAFRGRIAARRLHAALATVRAAAPAGDRPRLLEALDRVRGAVADALPESAGDRPDVRAARDRCVQACEDDADGAWLGEALDGALRAPEAPHRSNGNPIA